MQAADSARRCAFFLATLAPGRTVALSAPCHVGEAPVEMQFVHSGEQIVVINAAADARHAEAQGK
jgi:hypothetical protein